MRALLLLTVLAGCDGVAPSTAELSEPPSLVAVSAPAETTMDQVPRWPVAFRFADGLQVPVDRLAIDHVPRWRDGAALIDPQGRLYQVWPDGDRRMLARDAVVLATDGERLAYAVVPDLLGELRVHDGERERTLVRGMASIGVLRVDGPRVLFVGARPGGVAGVWVADDAGGRCVTNCDLRTGTPWRDRFVPPPSDPDLLEAP